MKPQINCNSEEWRTKVLPNCIFGLVFFTAGIPIMFICMFLYTRKDRYNPLFLKSYAIFWNKYQPGFYWWEIDLTYYGLKMLSWTGLIWGFKPVPKSILEEGRLGVSARTLQSTGVPAQATKTLAKNQSNEESEDDGHRALAAKVLSR